MPSYSYKAIDDAGRVLRGKVIALGETDAELRIAQEGLTNAAKHGDGSVILTTVWADDGLTIAIENGTAGEVDETGAGLGLVGMCERAAVNGGRLNAGARGDRFVVEAWLPADGEATS